MFAANMTEDEDKTRLMQRESSETSPLLNQFPASTNILVVDSNLITLLDMKKIMKHYAYQVTIYSDAEEALAFLTNCKHEINIVIWDFNMPKINGLEALKIIGSKMDLPVVIMSDDNQTESVMKATIDGACDYVMKPVREEVIANIWQHVVRKRMMSKSGLTQPIQSDLVQSHGLDQASDDSNTVDQDNGEHNIDKEEEEKATKKTPIMWTDLFQPVQSDLLQTYGFDRDNDVFKTIDQDNGEQNIGKEEGKAPKEPLMTWTGLVRPIQSDLVQIGLDQDNYKEKEKFPKEPLMTWTGLVQHVQSDRVQIGLDQDNDKEEEKAPKEPPITWTGLVQSDLVQIGLNQEKAPKEPLMTWTGLAQPVQSDLSQIGLGQDSDKEEEKAPKEPRITWTGIVQPVQSDLVQIGLDQDNDDFKTIDQNNGEQNIDKEEEKAAKKPRMVWTDIIQPVQSNLVQTNGSDQDNREQNIIKNEEKKPRKPRMTWTGDLHKKFLEAVEIGGGIEKANPKVLLKYMQEMKIKGLTRTNVASHLQKHRLNLEENGIRQQALGIGPSTIYSPSSLIGSSINVHTAKPYLMNDRAMNPIHQNQYPDGYLTMSNNNQFMTNPLPRLPYLEHHHLQQQQQQQQQQYQFPHQLNYVMNKREPEQAYSTAVTDGGLIYPRVPNDPNEFLMKSYNNSIGNLGHFDQCWR